MTIFENTLNREQSQAQRAAIVIRALIDRVDDWQIDAANDLVRSLKEGNYVDRLGPWLERETLADVKAILEELINKLHSMG